MNLDINLNFTLSKQLENEKNDKPMFGQDFTGMNNIGNSCYLNSVVQALNSLHEVKDQYYFAGLDHTQKCKLIPSECFYCQVAKIFIGLNNGKYS
jgi:ubiquitin carboxyl-terminal hydrolase 5/13